MAFDVTVGSSCRESCCGLAADWPSATVKGASVSGTEPVDAFHRSPVKISAARRCGELCCDPATPTYPTSVQNAAAARDQLRAGSLVAILGKRGSRGAEILGYLDRRRQWWGADRGEPVGGLRSIHCLTPRGRATPQMPYRANVRGKAQ